MMKFASIAVIGATSVLADAVHEPGKVAVITDANAAQFFEENPDGALVKYYAPWCGHCKSMAPAYDEAAEKLHAAGIKIPLAKCDTTVEKELGEKEEIRGYPTLKYYVSGKADEYDGPRDADGIVDWIKKMSGPAVAEEEPAADAKLSVTLYGESLADWFEAVAKKNRKGANWHFVAAGAPKVVLKHLGEDAIEKEGDMTEEELEALFKENNFPLFGALDGTTFGQYVDSGAGLIWALFAMTAETATTVVEEHREMMVEVAKAVGPAKFKTAWVNTDEFGKVLENMFGVKDFPRVIVQKKAGDQKSKFIFDGEMTKENIIQFVQDVESGKIQPTLKSEAVPEEPQKEAVKTIVGKSMEDMLFTEEKDVLFEVYAPWCGHCKKLEPEFEKVAKKITKEGFEDIVMLAKMDGTENDSPVDAFEWSGFPTLFYIKAGNKEPLKYDGPREAKGIWKWIKDNHSKSEEIKEKLKAKKADKEDAVEDEEEEKKEDDKEEL